MTAALWLAPLRGVTIRAFRAAFARPIAEAGFAGAFAPFIPANPGLRVSDRLLADLAPFPSVARSARPLVPQVITKDPDALRTLLKGLRERGFDRADLNAGCPFPMIRRRGRGAGLLRTPDLLERLLAAGCDEMGPGRFSLKTRLGLERPDELAALLPRINRYPLAALTVHARTARQMYAGACDLAAFRAVAAASANPVMYNGDWAWGAPRPSPLVMVGRAFVRALGAREDVQARLADYLEISCAELSGDRPVLGRMKELIAYWTESPRWRRLWPLVKICRTVDELRSVVSGLGPAAPTLPRADTP